MTGKRPRALTRTASVSQLESGNFSQEFSPLPENPKEKLKPTINEPFSAPRVVIGFDPKPVSYSDTLCTKSAPASPGYQEKAASPRSGLNSLLSRQWGGKVSEGVGLGIVLHAPTATPASEVTISILEREIERDHIAIPVKDDVSPPRGQCTAVSQPRRHSHPIPIQAQGVSTCHSSFQAPNQQCIGVVQPVSGTDRQGRHRQVDRSTPPWLEQDDLKVDRRDTFLLAPSPARHHMGENVLTTAACAAAHFLDECSFCKRHLAEGKDIFMYRGDKAFCSPECRAKQILLDERSMNCSSAAMKLGSGASSRRSRVAAAASSAAAA